MVYEVTQPEAVRPLFDGWEETMIWSCLQGIMGRLYTTQPERPGSALAVLGDFLFYAGRPSPELAAFWPYGAAKRFGILVPQSEAWGRLLAQCHGPAARPVLRYAIRKEPGIFDLDRLRRIAAAVPAGCSLRTIDTALYAQCLAEPWSRDLVAQFRDAAQFEALGLGVVLVRDGRILSGASSYARYRGGIEVEIDTRADCRRRGYATLCGAQLILECTARGLYPSWDAQNPASVALAEKLGYHFSHSYRPYELSLR